VRRGCLFQSTTDTEVILHLIAQPLFHRRRPLIDALKQVEGAYSLVALTNGALIGVRDPLGVRPLVLGRLDGAYVLASETCALDIIGAEFVRDIEPGEIVVIDDEGVRASSPSAGAAALLHLRVHLLRAPGFRDGGHARSTRRASASAPSWRAKRRARRRGRAGARFRRAGGDRLRRGSRHPLRARHHPQPLCRPHLHRADRPDPPSRRQAQAQRQPRRARRASA
jgi:hypothetical protein